MMMYLWPCNVPMPRFKRFGAMESTYKIKPSGAVTDGRWWACDNECFTRPFRPERMQKKLEAMEPYRGKCLFVVIPDIEWRHGERVFSAENAIKLFDQWKDHPMFDGWPLAFVAQNGQEDLPLPDGFDFLFIGGDTDWKLSPAADKCIKRAKKLGKRVHVGRVNSPTRIKHFDLVGVDTVDGTGPCYNPSRDAVRFTEALKQPTLWTAFTTTTKW